MKKQIPQQQLMRLVKFFIGLSPEKVKVLMRKNLWLLNLYSKSLQSSGLFYGLPSPAKLQKIYVKNIQKQSKLISQLCCETSDNVQLNVAFLLSGDVKLDVQGVREMQAMHQVQKLFVAGKSEHIKTLFAAIDDKPSKTVIKRFTSENVDHTLPLLLLRSGDYLHANAINVFFNALKSSDSKKLVLYCDCDILDSKIGRHKGEFMPDWNPDLQLSSGYIKTGVLIADAQTLVEFWRFAQLNPSQELISLWFAHLYLRKIVVDVVHIPLILVHQSKTYDTNWLGLLPKMSGASFEVLKGDHSEVVKLQWNRREQLIVSLVIPTKNSKELVKACIESILEKTKYPHYEILLVDNNSDEPQSLQYFDELSTHPKIRLLKYPHPFNYSAINNFAVKHAHGEVIGLINNDIEVISPFWLDYMVGHVARDDIGCVGAKLLYADDRVQHAGVVLGYGGGAGHAHKYFPRDHPGYLNRLAATGNFSAVTAACLLVKKNDYLAVGGLNEEELTIAFNDVDFCLKVLELGRRNLYCAEAELYHHESVSRGFEDTFEKQQRFESELNYLKTNWASYIAHDPAYNPNLTLRRENFSIKED